MINIGGWVKLYRELLDKAIWQTSTPEQKAVLITIMLMASHLRNDWEWQGKRFTVMPGQFVTSLPKLAEKAGVSVQNVRTALKKFEKYDFLTDCSTATGRLISIVNWEVYQSDEDDANRHTNRPLTDCQQTPNRPLTAIKNDKNNKNVKKDISSINTAMLAKPTQQTHPSHREDVPYDTIMNLYNTICLNLPAIRYVKGKRKEFTSARFREYGLDGIKELFTKANSSEFLCGGGDTAWRADFDWLMKPTNAPKVLEGKYDNRFSFDQPQKKAILRVQETVNERNNRLLDEFFLRGGEDDAGRTEAIAEYGAD